MVIMAEHINQVNMNDSMLSANTHSVKEEQCQEDFVEHKVYISETSIAVGSAELQGPILYGKIKQYQESTCLDNIKTELSSYEANEVQSDNVKIREGFNGGHLKMELDNGLLYCEHCEAYYRDYCIECGMLANILNKNTLNSADNGVQVDIPNNILEIQDCLGQTGIYALRIIPAGVKFGPFSGLIATECLWEMIGGKFVLDKNKSNHLNWMQFVNPTKNMCDGNLHVFQSEGNVYYQSTRQIQTGDELMVYFGKGCKNSPNKIAEVDFVTTTKGIGKDVYACTFCCLGFSSKSHLASHKTICVEDAAGKFIIEELTQCRFCQIHLDPKEYFEHHMAFCCERNARKSILLTQSAKETKRALNGHKRCLPQIYKCGICCRRFKTKDSLRLHVKNTHAYVGAKDDQEHSSTDYRNTHIKVEQSSSLDQKKIFKCSLCVFQAQYKRSIRIHVKTKHLKQFDFKCDSCEFGTNRKSKLEVHIKTKHLMIFDYKCDFCEFETNNKINLERHIKTKHLKQFDYKCDSCDYRTNKKSNLEQHIKTNHLMKFDYKCDSCEFGTNIKIDLKRHIKTKHLKKFDYKCDSCEFETNHKNNLEVHIKTKHLKEFDYKCDTCEYGTNKKSNLEYHIKAKHLKQFDFKCDSCEFETNIKNNLKRHIVTKHSNDLILNVTNVNVE